MSLYDTMFDQHDILTAQLLVTSPDFNSDERKRNIHNIISKLTTTGIVPIINENDAVSCNQGYETF